jgi:hypothetical protein
MGELILLTHERARRRRLREREAYEAEREQVRRERSDRLARLLGDDDGPCAA